MITSKWRTLFVNPLISPKYVECINVVARRFSEQSPSSFSDGVVDGLSCALSDTLTLFCMYISRFSPLSLPALTSLASDSFLSNVIKSLMCPMIIIFLKYILPCVNANERAYTEDDHQLTIASKELANEIVKQITQNNWIKKSICIIFWILSLFFFLSSFCS